MDTKTRINLRKSIAQWRGLLVKAKDPGDRSVFIKNIKMAEDILDTNEISQLPTFGKLRLVIEEDYKDELNAFQNDYNKSDNDLKRLAMKEAFMEYYNELNYDPDTIIVEFDGAMTLRRDNQKVNTTDFDFAPNKNEIYSRWIEKLNRLVRDERLSYIDYDESADRGAPQGGAFEKMILRHNKDIMKKLWKDFNEVRGKNNDQNRS